MNSISFKYQGDINRYFPIGDLSIQDTSIDIDGNTLTTMQASQLISECWNDAQNSTVQAFSSANHSFTSTSCLKAS